MFVDEKLQDYLETSSVIKSQSLVIAEWNMNIAENISKIGNYRFRPLDGTASKYSTVPNTYDPYDEGYFYTDATDADTVVDGGYTNENIPTSFLSKKQKEKMLYSLEECFSKFRPRSGINKARYFDGGFTHHTNINMARRPRYYMSSKDDNFKYWTSYRTENGIERGIAVNTVNDRHYIDDTAPYIVYNGLVPTNKIVVKMQTNVGDINLGPFNSLTGVSEDPFYGVANMTTPVKWKIQKLIDTNWIDLSTFDENSIRSNGEPVIGSDGYVEIAYGLIIPEAYPGFIHAGEYSSVSLLPEDSLIGYAYLVKDNSNSVGTYYVWTGSAYGSFVPEYKWSLSDESISPRTLLVNDLVSPDSYTNPSDGLTKFRELDYIQGLRIVVETMNKVGATLDLIELSPRLAVNLSEKTSSFSLKKPASDLGISGMPVGQLLVATGSVDIFDYDQAFNPNNENSVLFGYNSKNVQFKFYEIVKDLDSIDYYIPLKSMYVDGFPYMNNKDRHVSIELRDMFFYFELTTAPQLLIQNASLSYAISLLLDSAGFSNYTFKRNTGENELIIPFFFVAPDKSIAEVLQDLAISTQSAMFFDEYNNLVVMSKNYIMPTEDERATDITLYGSVDSMDTGVQKNETTKPKLANIIDASSQQNQVYNAGKITYTSRYIQRSYGSIKQASLVDRDKTWIYKPALLWEITGTETTKSVNDEVETQSSYVLGAIPLNSDLPIDIPYVSNNTIVNNTIDFGEGIYWMTRYNGYLYSSGEIIRFDAVQYNIPSLSQVDGATVNVASNNVWITNVQEYQRYFSKLSFNGKIYPTGLVRIYAEPNYETVDGVTVLKNGPVAKHGRGQFGTSVINHSAGLSSYWSNNDNIRGCLMQSKYLFNTDILPTGVVGAAGVSNTIAQKTTRNGIIRNFLSSSYINEVELNNLYSTQAGTVQSSALIMNGPSFATTEKPIDFVSYVFKPLEDRFSHFGTRVRIVGKINNNTSTTQTPIGSTAYYVVTESSPETSINIGGASGGLAVMINPETNNGYYFEIAALTESNIESYAGTANIANIIFYKVKKNTSDSTAMPIKLWSGLSKIVVDSGSFVGQSRIVGEETTTVYDLAVEYENIGTTRRFFLYINNKLVTTVDDPDPLPIYNNMALFVRGSSRLMFENIYALTNNYSQNTVSALDTPVNSAYGDDEVSANESFRKYAISGVIQSTYLSGISTAQPPQYSIYFEEFGTIMREASYMNIRYDKAYPALYAKISPTFNQIKGYTIAGFTAGAYGADFLIFNATDTAISLDETTGNYLRIQGITFTQASQHELTVDDYFSKRSDFSNPDFTNDGVIVSPVKFKKDYQDIKNSRLTYGKNEFTLDSPYIQSQDDANNLMDWMISKLMKPRRSVGIKIFAMPTLQLGDIVKIDYSSDNVDQILTADSRYVIYNIEYQKSSNGPEMTVYLSEVL